MGHGSYNEMRVSVCVYVCVCVCVCSTPNKRATFSCLQAAMALSLRDAVPLFYPVSQLSFAALGKTFFVLTHASRLAAARVAKQVRVYEIYQSNNDVDVIVNRSIKLPVQKYGNYENRKRITAQKGR